MIDYELEKLIEKYNEYNHKKSFEIIKVKEDIIKYIQEKTNTSKQVSNYIFDFAYEQGKLYGQYELAVWIDDLIKFINKCKEIFNNGND